MFFHSALNMWFKMAAYSMPKTPGRRSISNVAFANPIAHGHRLNNSPGIDHVIIETQGVFGFIWCYIRQPHG